MLIVLSGCSEKVVYEDQEAEVVEQEKKPVEKEIQQMFVEYTSFHFIVDWLSNEEILFVDKEDGNFRLKAFHIYSEEIKTIYEAETMIIDVLIHPSKEYILVQTSASEASATLKILTLDGLVHNEVTIESAELEIEWNDLDASSILLTAFYEDWSFDTFIYDGETNQIQLLAIETPFPKWLGMNHFVVLSEALDGGTEIVVYDVETGEEQALTEGNILSYDTFKESLLVVELTEDDKVQYTILTAALEAIANWTMEPTNEYSEWFTPNFEWINENSLFTFRPEDTGIANELIKYEAHEITVFMNRIEDTALICSPDTKNCLAGHGLEKILDLENKVSIDWLSFVED